MTSSQKRLSVLGSLRQDREGKQGAACHGESRQSRGLSGSRPSAGKGGTQEREGLKYILVWAVSPIRSQFLG